MKQFNIYLFLTLAAILFSCSSRDKNREAYTIQKDNFEASLIESGELQALNASYIVMPFLNWKFGWQYKITDLKGHGDKVKPGDVVARIDNSPIMKAKIETQNNLDMQQANLNKLLVQKISQEESQLSSLSIAQATYDLAKLQLDKFKFESEKRQRVKKLEFDMATIALNKVKVINKLSLVSLEKTLHIQQIRVTQLKNELKDVDKTLGLLDIKCPYAGLFQVSINEETRQLVKIGDKIWPGFKIGKVPDLSKMKIQSTINETDISKLELNQKVLVRLDAYPIKPFTGKITKIGRISYKKDNDSNVKVFDYEVILDKADPILKPGMTVSCEIIFANLKNTYFVENECILSKGKDYYVLLENGRKELPVKLGPKQSKYTVIYGDIRQGQKLVPADLVNVKIN